MAAGTWATATSIPGNAAEEAAVYAQCNVFVLGGTPDGYAINNNTYSANVGCGLCCPPTPTPTVTFTPTATYTPTNTSTPTPSPTPTATFTPCGWPGNTCTPTNTFTPTPTPIDAFYVSKNIFNANQESVSIFVAFPNPGHYTLSIYNSAGEHIKTMDTQQLRTSYQSYYLWDGKNKYGQDCASGMYIIYVAEPLHRKLARVLLIRR